MVYNNDNCSFPAQKVPNSKKSQAEWYSACCDFIISNSRASVNITICKI